jgi:hypothetical protein
MLLAFHLRTSPWLSAIELSVATPGAAPLAASLLQLAQWTAAVAGGLMTLWALWSLCRQRFAPPTDGVGRPASRAVVPWLAAAGPAVVALIEALKVQG